MINDPSPTPRRRRAEKIRQAILDTAIELLSEKGSQDLSLREIARRLDYTPAALYEYYASREAILEAVAVEADRRMTAALAPLPDALPVAEQIVQAGLAYIRFARQNPALYLLYASWPAAVGPGGELRFANGASYRLLVSLLERGVEQSKLGQRNGLDVPEMAYLCWGVVHGLASLQLGALKGAYPDFDQVDEPALRVLVDSLK